MKSIVYALLAALCNSFIGIFSTVLMDSGLASPQVAFLRCATAFCITLALCLGRRETRTALKVSASQLVRRMVLALLAGSGYSLYIFLTKKWSVPAGLPTLCHLFLFGTLFLGVQLAASGNLVGLHASHLPWIAALAIVPTMGRFYFTNKALNHGPAGEVQLVEMTEPFLATVLGFFVLGQRVSPTDLAGGILIVIGLLILERRAILSAFKG